LAECSREIACDYRRRTYLLRSNSNVIKTHQFAPVGCLVPFMTQVCSGLHVGGGARGRQDLTVGHSYLLRRNVSFMFRDLPLTLLVHLLPINMLFRYLNLPLIWVCEWHICVLTGVGMDGDGPCHPPEAPNQRSESGTYRYYCQYKTPMLEPTRATRHVSLLSSRLEE